MSAPTSYEYRVVGIHHWTEGDTVEVLDGPAFDPMTLDMRGMAKDWHPAFDRIVVQGRTVTEWDER